MECPFVARHQADVAGVVSCFDRVVLTDAGHRPCPGHGELAAHPPGSVGGLPALCRADARGDP